MDASINSLLNTYSAEATGARTDALEAKLKSAQGKDQTDEELMEVAKQFESYLVEQVLSKVKDNMLGTTEDEDNKYLDYFGDVAMQKFAPILAENADLGIAQQLYEAMKNQNQTVIPMAEDADKSAETAEKLSTDTEKTKAVSEVSEKTETPKVSAISM